MNINRSISNLKSSNKSLKRKKSIHSDISESKKSISKKKLKRISAIANIEEMEINNHNIDINHINEENFSKNSKIIYDDSDEDLLSSHGREMTNEILSTDMTIPIDKNDVTEKLTDSFIYCREKEKDFIINFLKANDSKNLFICGQPGTGKTSLVMEIFNSGLPEIEFSFKIYINCMCVLSVKDFYDEVFKFFNRTENLITLKKIYSGADKIFEEMTNILKLPASKNNNLTKFLKYLSQSYVSKKITPIILLDEVDQFYQKNNDIIFYDILNIPFISACNVKIIMISNNSEFDKYIIPKIENRKIKIEKYVFQPYSHVEINKILMQKLQEINFVKYFDEMSIRFISSKLANKSGDIRPAIDMVKKLILNFKDDFINGKIINLREVMNIMNQQYSHFTEIIRDLTFEQKLVVVSIYFVCVNYDTNILSEDQIVAQYKLIKKTHFNDILNLSEFDQVMKSLLDIGVITNFKNKNNKMIKIQPKMEDIQLIFGEDEFFFNLFKIK